MDEKSPTSKTDSQIVGILKNGGNVTPKHDADTDYAAAATGVNGHSDKLSAGLERLNAVTRRKSLTPSITLETPNGEQNGNHADGLNGRLDDGDNGHTDTDEEDTDVDDDNHSAEDPVSRQ